MSQSPILKIVLDSVEINNCRKISVLYAGMLDKTKGRMDNELHVQRWTPDINRPNKSKLCFQNHSRLLT